MAGSAVTGAETFLRTGEDGEFFRKVSSDSSDKTGPTFVQRAMNANGALIAEL